MRTFAILLLTGSLVIAAFVARSHLRAAEKRTNQLEARLGELESELEDLRARMAADRLVVHGRPACRAEQLADLPKVQEAGDKPQVNAKGADDDLTVEGRATADDGDVEKMRETMESSFAGQQPDANWGPGTAAEVRAKVVTGLSKDSQLRSIECRQTMCRLETSHHDERTYREFLSGSLSTPDFNWQGAMAFATLRTESSGEMTTVAYLMRPGYPPPNADEVN